MRKLIVPIIWLTIPFMALAEGPKFRHKEPEKEQEFQNIYQDLRNKLPVPLNTASGTITGQFNVGNRFVVSTTGEVTQPLQPSFLARQGSIATDATGDSTAYVGGYGTEIFDQGSDYDNTTFTFTAPVSGRYLFTALCYFTDVGAGHTQKVIQLSTSNRAYADETNVLSATAVSRTISVVADMDANDTCLVHITAAGGTKTVDINGISVSLNQFSGSLLN